MPIERTLIILKPDAVKRKLCGKIISVFEDAGLDIIAAKFFTPPKELLNKHYSCAPEYIESLGRKNLGASADKAACMKQGQIVYDRLMDYITGGVMAMVLSGNEAVAIVRKLCGTTNPAAADPATIRGKYCMDSYDLSNAEKRACHNLMHASGTADEAAFEISLWFPELS
ncbi:MAG: hypothetical protein LBG89_02805 [Rickettsiales bacterium]|jgi:nucleoside-diphosphate kinase|nr:hypothetical protein [Rickettsiales bacterium]